MSAIRPLLQRFTLHTHSLRAAACLITAVSLMLALPGFEPAAAVFAQTRTEQGPRLPFIADDAAYLWPTNASPFLSGTFGETRAAHLHAGIDIKTWGREGFDVYASREGTLFRIQTGHSGYGNALYLRHDDGSFTVYAHLRNFIPSLERLADSLRLPTFSHLLDERVDQLGIRFGQGDRIAFTGSTGAGPPHLHFEIRSPDNIAWNPLLAGFKVKDTVAPRIRSILVEELGAGDGPGRTVVSSQRVRPNRMPRGGTGSSGGTGSGGRGLGSGTQPALKPVSSSSIIAISLDADDQADDVSNVYAVYRLELWKDGERIFASQADAMPFEAAGHLFVDRHYRELRQRGKGFQRLHLMPGNRLPFYQAGSERGFLQLEPGRHDITLLATDLFGNQTRETITITAEARADSDSEPAGPDASGEGSRGPSETWMDGSVRIEAARPTAGSFRIDTVLTPGVRHELASPDQRVRIAMPAGALFDTLRLVVNGSLEGTSMWMKVESEPLPFDHPVRIHLHLDDSSAALHSGLRWGTAGAEGGRIGNPGRPIAIGKSGRHLTFQTRELGSFELYQDSLGPELSTPFQARTLSGVPSIGIRVSDRQSPLAVESARFVIDGRRGIPLYDPDRRMFVFLHPDAHPRSGRTIEFEVADVAGNLTSMRWERDGTGRYVQRAITTTRREEAR